MKLLKILCIVFLFASCENEISEIPTDELNSNSIKDLETQLKSQAPEQPGSNMKVYRYEDSYTFFIRDYEKDLLAVISLDVISLCTGNGPNLEPVSFQDIVLEEGSENEAPRINQLIKGENVKVSIWSSGILACSYFLNNEPVFEGIGDYVFTDNDSFAFDRNGSNSNAFGMTFKGEGIKILWRAIWDGENIDGLKEVAKIELE